MPDRAAIPESLRLQLAAFRRDLWRVKVMEAVAAGLIGLLFSFLLVYGLDRIWPTPGWARLLILLVGVSLFAGFAPYWLHRWVWRRRREEQLARLIARRFPGLGDRLLGVIELQDQVGNEDVLSSRLREAAMEAVAAETGKRDLVEALPEQMHRRWSVAAVVLALLAVLVLGLTPRAGFNALRRWLLPLSDTERYTFSKLVDAPDYLAVPFGEAFSVSLRLSENSEQRPALAVGRLGGQAELEAALDGDGYDFVFPGQQDPGVIRFKVGDLRHELRVEPVMRPAVERVRAVVRPPEYLEIPERTVDVGSGVVSAVAGSMVGMRFDMTRALESGGYGPTRQLVGQGGVDEPGGHEPMEGELEIEGATARTTMLEVGGEPFELPVFWKDRLGLDGESGFSVRLDIVSDAAPACYLQGIDRQVVMLPEETLEFELLAEDDFGVRSMGLEWSGEFTRPTDEAAAEGSQEIRKGGSERRRLLEPAMFSPKVLGISPQKILLRGYVEDYLPERGRVYSKPVVVYVLTRDEHAQLLKNQFDRQITELEDLARRELNLLDENRRLEKLDGEELQDEAGRSRLKQQENEEKESERRMEELTEKMEELMKDAVRNGDIDKKTMKKMAESLKSMQELSSEDLPEVRGKLGESQEESNTKEKSKEDVSEAVEKQQEAVEKMREAIEQANDANRRFEAGTFINRLRKAADEEKGVVSALKEQFVRVLGVEKSAMDPADERGLSEVTGQQSDTASDVRWIQEDLGNYYARTEDETFKDVMEQMRESQVDLGLEEVRMKLMSNHSFEAAEEAMKWGDKLAEWAGLLEGEKGESGGGGGDGNGAPNSEDQDFEFMLRVMKMIQQEQDLRSRTRALEQMKRQHAVDQAEGGAR
ncbi:MAG: hypothetical protein ACQCXQ_04525 [Verrucomicrobiales bacterium]|nr:hypothetical protein [Verrucomicrobiota bacterium JB025]